MKNHRLIKYAQKNGKEIHISKVESGLKSGCICLACGEKLIAKKGELAKPQEHFAHHNIENCKYGYETTLHYEAKAILESEKKITLPFRKNIIKTSNLNGLLYWKYQDNQLGVIEDRIFDLTNITSEMKLHNIIPDIKALINGREILIEIAVTHKICEEKKQKLDKIGIPTIEINLSGLKNDFTDSELSLNVIENTKNKKWIYNVKDENIIYELKNSFDSIYEDLKGLIVTKMIKGYKNNPKIFDCNNPLIGKSVNLVDCRKCDYNLATYDHNVVCGFNNYKEIVKVIEKSTDNNQASFSTLNPTA